MRRALLAVFVGLLFTSVAPAHPKPQIVRAGYPIAAGASNTGEADWWLLVNEHGRWTRWDGPYYDEFECDEDRGIWYRANPHKAFVCAEAQ